MLNEMHTNSYTGPRLQALDKTFCYKCNGTKREAGRAEAGRFSRFSKNSLKMF